MENQKETIELNITDISDMGQGIGRIDGIVVFVDGALLGDLVRAEVTERKKNFMKANVVEILEPSENRVDPQCPYSADCGGCAYMELSYERELQIKEQHIKDKIERIAGITSYECEPIIGMSAPAFYRNKTEFAISKDGKIGFNRLNTNEVVDIPECHISSPVSNTILKFLRSREQSELKEIRKATIRTSFSTGEIMVIFETKVSDVDRFIPLIEGMDNAVNVLVESMADDEMEVPSLESVYIFDKTKKKNPYTLIAGKRTIDDEMMGLKFEISPASFYQTNPVQTQKLFGKVSDYVAASGNEKLFDLYCGVGSIGLMLAGAVSEVWGVESVKDAVLDANRNAVINGIVNARYLAGKAEEMMDQLKIDDKSIILIDPPRAGCKQGVLSAIGGSPAKKIVYVSCDPGTLARDIKTLNSYGFKIDKVTPVDMFPRTVHVECVVLMSRVEV